ncbi:MAG: tetratricopeptide repeat protein [Flavobacteriaceae bacterium]|nr:MAG: tetratricopeptide repeat protein [Flavobacteriaceae bacterium]
MQRFFLNSSTFVLITMLFPNLFFSQQSDIDVNVFNDYNHAVKLFNNKAYAAAQKNFIKVSKQLKDKTNLKAEADYYDAICAIRLQQTGADKKVLNFVEKHPNSTKKDKAYFLVGNYYFANREAAHALKWYSKTNRDGLSEDNKKELDFKMGYALLTTQRLTSAKSRFLKLINDAKYGNDSRYYYGYIAYKQEDYEEAKTTLNMLADEEAYKNEVTYFLLDISFKSGKFEKCIEVGLKLLEKAKPKERSEIAKIVGESYFNLKEYKKAIPYLEEYRGKKGKWSNTDYYQLGFVYYKQNDFKKAVSYFNKIIDTKNNVSQNAYYNLGECYMHLDKKTEALNAFKNASEMDFNATVKEDAALNYAKLSYEEGNPYKSVAEVLQDFLKAYPESPSYQEINELVVSSYLYQQDYIGALAYLAKNKSAQNKELTYEVSYYRGVQLFTEKKLPESVPFFIAGMKSSDKIITVKSQYWKAEANYQLGNFQNALDDFIAFKKNVYSKKVEEFKEVDYHLGYSYFKLKKYREAAKAFQAFIATNNEDIVITDDAIVRKGDSEFATKDYRKAIKTYKKVIDSYDTGADYAQYQSAMSYGFLKNNNEKINQLLSFNKNFQTSNLKDDAYFQLGNTYAIEKDVDNAHIFYQKLITEFPKSSYNPNSLLRKGLLYFNENENDKALNLFKQIVAKYPNSNEAKQAVSSARNVYIELGTVDEYAIWVKTIKFVNVSDAELDNTMYESAENKFLENKTNAAISGFQKYLKTFPDGLHALKSNFQLAQLLVKTDKKEQAIPNYQYVIDQGQSEFSEETLNKLSQILLEKEDWVHATPLLVRLEAEANLPQNIIYAQSNLMKGYYWADDYKNAVAYAEKVLQNTKIDTSLEYDAKIIIARAAYKTDDYTKAEEFYKEVERNARGELKAEALYYSAFFKNYHKEYAESNKVIQEVISDYSAYKYWGSKSFIIMAKNYYALENADPYQATFILENIIKNFSQFEDVIEEAQKELKKIKANEAKTNISVTPKNKK